MLGDVPGCASRRFAAEAALGGARFRASAALGRADGVPGLERKLGVDGPEPGRSLGMRIEAVGPVAVGRASPERRRSQPAGHPVGNDRFHARLAEGAAGLLVGRESACRLDHLARPAPVMFCCAVSITASRSPQPGQVLVGGCGSVSLIDCCQCGWPMPVHALIDQACCISAPTGACRTPRPWSAMRPLHLDLGVRMRSADRASISTGMPGLRLGGHAAARPRAARRADQERQQE